MNRPKAKGCKNERLKNPIEKSRFIFKESSSFRAPSFKQKGIKIGLSTVYIYLFQMKFVNPFFQWEKSEFSLHAEEYKGWLWEGCWKVSINLN